MFLFLLILLYSGKYSPSASPFSRFTWFGDSRSLIRKGSHERARHGPIRFGRQGTCLNRPGYPTILSHLPLLNRVPSFDPWNVPASPRQRVSNHTTQLDSNTIKNKSSPQFTGEHCHASQRTNRRTNERTKDGDSDESRHGKQVLLGGHFAGSTTTTKTFGNPNPNPTSTKPGRTSQHLVSGSRRNGS